MTKVTFSTTKEYFKVEAEGHATGSKEVCSGISAIMQGLLWYVIENYKDYAYQADDGILRISFPRTNASSEAFKLVKSAIKGIEKGYSEYVCVLGCE